MKKLIYIFVLITFLGCDTESAFDCFQTSGSIIQKEIMVSSFNRILVNRDVELIVKQGIDYQVVIETGKNLINDVTAEVVGNQLVLTDDNSCNYVRDFGITKVFVTTPTLTEIRCSTQYEISSDGVLSFNDLVLISENFFSPESFPIGDFRLELDIENLNIISNNLSFYFLNGKAENLSINFAAGNGRFEGQDLVAQNINVFHRGSNDMVVNPQQSLTGSIRSTGDVISVNEPPIVNVEEVFSGRLIFN
jgi:hypothetical protein